MTKKVKNKNQNMFIRNNGKNHVHVLYPLLYVAKKEKQHKVTRYLWGQKEKKT